MAVHLQQATDQLVVTIHFHFQISPAQAPTVKLLCKIQSKIAIYQETVTVSEKLSPQV